MPGQDDPDLEQRRYTFGSRQVLYQRYFGGNTLNNSVVHDTLYDKQRMTCRAC